MTTADAVQARGPFVGVWSLESFTEQSGSSEELNPLGVAAVGFLIYTADGFVFRSVDEERPESSRNRPMGCCRVGSRIESGKRVHRILWGICSGRGAR